MQSSITNLQPKSNALYADWISVWVISLFLYWVSRSHSCYYSYAASAQSQDFELYLQSVSDTHFHLQQLWRYNTHAVEMRIDHLNSMTGAGTEAQTIMVHDIPEINKVSYPMHRMHCHQQSHLLLTQSSALCNSKYPAATHAPTACSCLEGFLNQQCTITYQGQMEVQRRVTATQG